MAVLDLFNSSRQADELCVVYCKCHANIRLGCDDAILVRLETNSNRKHIVWMDASQARYGVFGYVRAFHEFNEDQDDDLGDAKYRQEIRPDQDVFGYNGSFYYLHATMNGNYTIRRLYAYGSQRVVEMIESSEERDAIEAIFPVNFYLFDGKKRNYAFTGWGISHPNCCNYMPIFEEDRHYFEEYHDRLSAFIREELPVGTIFKNNGYYYKIVTDADGKICLEYSKLVFALGRTPTLANNPPPEHKAKVFFVDFKNVSNK